MLEQLSESLLRELPWWASMGGAVLLTLAGAIARRVARRSAKPQGERLGRLEQLVESERTRRRQIEVELLHYGVELPYWPPDGPHRPRLRPPAPDDEDQGEDLEPLSPETQIRRIPVPPLDPAVGARHRRG